MPNFATVHARVLSGIERFFAAIGLPVHDAEHALIRAAEFRGRARELRDPLDPSRVLALDNSGACLALRLAENDAVAGATPYFAGARRNRALVREIVAGDGPGQDRLVVHLAGRNDQPKFEVEAFVHDLATKRDVLAVGKPTNVALTLLADDFTCRAVEAPARFAELGDASSAVVATPQPARALVRGRIVRVSTPINRTSRVHFQHARIEVQGLTLDVVAPEPDKERPDEELRAESVFEGLALVVGTLDPARHDGTMPAMQR